MLLTPVLPAQLHPEPDEARGLLRRELLERQYHDENLLLRLLDAVARLLDRAAGAAGAVSGLPALAATLVGVLLVATLVWLTTRLSRSARRQHDPVGPVFAEQQASASEHRQLAEQALAAGETGMAVVEAFRAAVLRGVEAGFSAHRPGATATELVAQLPDQLRGPAGVVARDFDTVLYGHRSVSADAARRALDLDDACAGALR